MHFGRTRPLDAWAKAVSACFCYGRIERILEKLADRGSLQNLFATEFFDDSDLWSKLVSLDSIGSLPVARGDSCRGGGSSIATAGP
jgi:hypothetical protein